MIYFLLPRPPQIIRSDKSYLDLFSERKADLVYLTVRSQPPFHTASAEHSLSGQVISDRNVARVGSQADSPTTLDALSDKDVYIIGGIVDRNRFKGLTFDKAQQQARLALLRPAPPLNCSLAHTRMQARMHKVFDFRPSEVSLLISGCARRASALQSCRSGSTLPLRVPRSSR